MCSRLNTAIKIALSGVVLAFIVRQTDIRSIVDTIGTISCVAVAAGILVVLAQMVGSAERLVLVIARFGDQLSIKESIKITLEGMFFSQTFISFLGGDALRIWRVRQRGLALTEATSVVVLDRLMGILANHSLLLVSLPWLLTLSSDSRIRIALLLLAFTGIGGFAWIMLVAALRGRGGYLHRLRVRFPFRVLVELVLEAASVGGQFLTAYRQLALVFLVSGFVAIANMIVFLIVLLGMGVEFYLAVGCALLVPAVLEIAMLPISFAGWGVREGAAVVAFGALGLPAQQALASSVAFGLIVGVVSLIGGILWLIDRDRLVHFSEHEKRFRA